SFQSVITSFFLFFDSMATPEVEAAPVVVEVINQPDEATEQKISLEKEEEAAPAAVEEASPPVETNEVETPAAVVEEPPKEVE
ncbi:hypothetical protein INN88_15445, partial [Staphylococcus aureus]|nr:hypothetical protein [Staphylococcus aureus]